MKFDEWVSFFKQYDEKKLFSFSDLLVLTGEPISNLSVQLNRLIKADLLRRPARNWYENPFNIPSNEEIAMILRPPSYLSLEYALYKHDIISQQIHILTLVTTQLPYTFKTASQVYEFHQVKKPLFFGYETINNVHIADAEKAILDFIYLRWSKNKDLTKKQMQSFFDSMYVDELNKRKLKNYVRSYDTQTKDVIEEINVI